MTNLTEQWKKGELKEGWYYIRNKGHSIKFNQMAFFMVFGEVSYWTNCKDEDVEEVLAPVPSYEEWQELSKQRNQLIRDVKDLAYIQEENQQLKELLKECKETIETSVWGNCSELTDQIDEVIGEKKCR